MKLIDKKAGPQHKHETILSVRNLSFGYTRKRSELSEISFDLHKGEWTTILGPNGSGKSTLAKIIVRVQKYRQGEITLNNKPIKDFKNREYARQVAYIPQVIDVPEGIKVYDFVAFGRNPWIAFGAKMSQRDHQIVNDALVKIKAINIKDKMMEEISGGQRQRVFLALAIAQDTPVIILDEPTTYLDIKAQYEVLEVLSDLHAEGKTVVTVLHDINQAVQFSDEIIILSDGKIHALGTPDKVVTEKMLRDVYGVQTELYTDKSGLKYITDIKILKDPDKKSPSLNK